MDNLLSGDLPYAIAESFFHPPDQRSYTNLEEASGHRWNLHTLRGPAIPSTGDEEAGESTPLIVGEKEAQRERTARLALNSGLPYKGFADHASQHDSQLCSGRRQGCSCVVLVLHLPHSVLGRLCARSSLNVHYSWYDLGDRKAE